MKGKEWGSTSSPLMMTVPRPSTGRHPNPLRKVKICNKEMVFFSPKEWQHLIYYSHAFIIRKSAQRMKAVQPVGENISFFLRLRSGDKCDPHDAHPSPLSVFLKGCGLTMEMHESARHMKYSDEHYQSEMCGDIYQIRTS